jgi:hypothetical protein
VYLDGSTHYGRLSDAFVTAYNRDEMGIYDFKEGRERYIMSDEKRPSERNNTRMPESAAPTGGGRKYMLFGKDQSAAQIADAIQEQIDNQDS